MTVQVTLSVSERLMEQAQQFADDIEQDAASVLAETLELLWPTFGDDIETMREQLRLVGIHQRRHHHG